MKVLKAFGRIFWTIISFVLLIVAVLCLLLLSPQVIAIFNVPLMTISSVATLTFPPLAGLFGGTVDATLSTGLFVDGKLQGEYVDTTLQGVEVGFDYICLIGLILGVIGVLMAIFFYRKKSLLGVSALFTLASTAIVACQDLTFLFVNPELKELIESAAGSSLSTSGMIELGTISIGGIIFAVCMGLLFLISLVRFFVTKKEK